MNYIKDTQGELKALIELNQNCNLKCEYCFYNDYGRKENYISIESFKSTIKSGTTHVYLTGGEPFINSDILKIIEYISHNKMKSTIFCNGVALSKLEQYKFNYILENITKLIITFDDFEENYSLRSIENKYILNAIKKVLEYDQNKLEVKIGVNNYNVNKFEDTVKRLIEVGVQKISINLIHNIDTSMKSFEIDDREKLNYVFSIINEFKGYFDMKHTDYLKQFLNGKTEDLVKTCKAGQSFYFVNCEAKEYMCPVYFENDNVNKSECISKKCINLWEMY